MTLVLDANAAIELAFGKSRSHRVGKFVEDSTRIVVPFRFYIFQKFAMSHGNIIVFIMSILMSVRMLCNDALLS